MNKFIEDTFKFNGMKKNEWESHLKPVDDINLKFPDFEGKGELQEFIANKLKNASRIMIGGDYDSDCISGAVVLYRFLKHAGFKVFPYIPLREWGYGLNAAKIKEYKDKYNIDLIITVDCGISNKKEIEYAKSIGIETIITDHHSVPNELPDAKFILHPQVTKGLEEMVDFSGSGMAYFFCHVAEEKLQAGFSIEDWIPLAATGTIGDMTKLRGLNRDFVKVGIEKAKTTNIVGLNALQLVKKINVKHIDEQDFAFSIIPLINAAGRLYNPIYAFALLATEDTDAAMKWAYKLDNINIERKQICTEYYDEIYPFVDNELNAIIVDGDFRHGIVGITAANLCDDFQLPAFVLAKECGFYRGSARGPHWFNVVDALNHASESLIGYGGHPAAGGFSLDENNFEMFKNLIKENAGQQAINKSGIKTMRWKQEYNEIDLLDSILKLKPFGQGFHKPLFKNKAQIERTWKKHLFTTVNGIKANGWNKYSNDLTEGMEYSMLYTVDASTYGRKNPYVVANIERIIK